MQFRLRHSKRFWHRKVLGFGKKKKRPYLQMSFLLLDVLGSPFVARDRTDPRSCHSQKNDPGIRRRGPTHFMSCFPLVSAFFGNSEKSEVGICGDGLLMKLNQTQTSNFFDKWSVQGELYSFSVSYCPLNIVKLACGRYFFRIFVGRSCHLCGRAI